MWPKKGKESIPNLLTRRHEHCCLEITPLWSYLSKHVWQIGHFLCFNFIGGASAATSCLALEASDFCTFACSVKSVHYSNQASSISIANPLFWRDKTTALQTAVMPLGWNHSFRWVLSNTRIQIKRKVLESAAANDSPERVVCVRRVAAGEWATGQRVLISAVSNWEACTLQPNPEMRKAFITEQTPAPPGSRRLSTVNRKGRNTQAWLHKWDSSMLVWTPACARDGGGAR